MLRRARAHVGGDVEHVLGRHGADSLSTLAVSYRALAAVTATKRGISISALESSS